MPERSIDREGAGASPSGAVLPSRAWRRIIICVSSSDLAPLVVMNPGSSVPAELRAGVIIGGMGRLVDLDAAAGGADATSR
jgi:hypothetical protein